MPLELLQRRNTVQKCKLGKSNLEVSAIGLGCMGMSSAYGSPIDRQESISLIRTAIESGAHCHLFRRDFKSSTRPIVTSSG